MFVFFVCCLAIACSAISDNIEKKVSLSIGVDPTFPPFAMQENENRVIGFEIELMQAIADRDDMKIEWKNIAFDQLIPTLEKRQIQAIMSSMKITPKRSEIVAFSRPYFHSGLAIAVRDEDKKIKGLKDLENKIIAVEIGTEGAREAEKILGAKVSKFSSIAIALYQLKNGTIDAVLNDAALTLHAIKIGNLDGLKVIDELLTQEYYGIALPKDSEYLEPINDILEELIVDRTYEELYRQWFNSEPHTLPKIAANLE
ncbi:basic amino acid ABC transporter substrate-binding protein [Spirulina sp. 06S082]|uniref:basic amino acid ABC transporter substrate-binding protein n=1 Tax=Spirulina sp. 06S082 TaxID=3110248 RepID=UPI002B21B20C|nr:basic amino acid ABC transporter substrate-binding protein [Spirulina sp. 06S082]MEA5468756.1 basic amino acid ABC transporter substrate-binding protein [Spirulina sp. 06S082]